MIDKNVLNQINAINTELIDLRERLKKIENRKLKNVQDSVRGSSNTYPYIQHTCVISGIENNLKDKKSKNKYKRMIKNKEQKLGKLINQLEYELNSIEDSELRQIIRYKYEDNMNWLQIMTKMKYNSEDTARKKIERFLKNNNLSGLSGKNMLK